MKKIIYGILLALGIIAFSSVCKVKADTYTPVISRNGSVYYEATVQPICAWAGAMGNSTVRNFNVIFPYRCAPYRVNGSNYTLNYTVSGYGVEYYAYTMANPSDHVSLEVTHSGATYKWIAPFPLFDNVNDAIAYSKGQPYNAGNIIAGEIPTTYSFANDTDYVPFHAHYEGHTELTTAGIGGSIEWYENYLVTTTNTPPNFHHIAFNIHYKMPTRDTLYNNITSEFISREFTWRGLISDEIDWITTYNSGRYVNNGITYADYTYPLVLDSAGALSMSYLMDGYDGSQLYNSSVHHNAIKHFYGDPQGSFFDESYVADILHANMFAYIDYIEVHYVAYNESSHKYISYPSLFYYPDLLNYDGTIYRKRDINTTPASTKPTGDISETDFNNVGSTNNYPTKEVEYTTQLQKLLDNIVIDSGDTIINNYIDGVGVKLDDWWNDGDIDINENIGNLYSLLKSVANIGLIFGLVFNGFIPNTALVILGFALLLIPIVLIIKLIRG